MLRKMYVLIISCLMKIQFCSAIFGEYITNFDRTLNSISQSTGKQIEKEFSFLRFAGIGRGAPNGIIEVEKLIFEVNRILSKDEGVIIISKIIQTYLKNMYSDKNIKTYLKKHPFTYQNLEIDLYIYDKNGYLALHPDIGFFTLLEGNISYKTMIRNEKSYLQKESYIEEPYEEAAKRLGVWPPPMPEGLN